MFNNLVEEGLLDKMVLASIEEASRLLDLFGLTDYKEELETILDGKFMGDDSTSEIRDVFVSQLDLLANELGFVFEHENLRFKIDFLNGVVTVSDLDEQIKEDLLQEVGVIESNIEVLNIVVLPYMLENTSDLIFLFSDVSDKFIDVISAMLSTNNITSVDDAFKFADILSYIKDRFKITEEDALWLKASIEEYLDLSMKQIMDSINYERDVDKGFKIISLLYMSTANNYQSEFVKYFTFLKEKDSELYNYVFRVSGELNEKE